MNTMETSPQMQIPRPGRGKQRTILGLLRNKAESVVFVAPGLVVYVVFMILPILIALYYSFTNWDGISSSMNWIGISNFSRALRDPEFLRALLVTVFITVVSTLVLNVFGIVLAVLLNHKGKMTNIYRSIFFFPMMLSQVAVGIIWQTILNYNGIFNQIGTALGIPKVNFLGHANFAVVTITGVIVWQSIGFTTVLYLAALQTISQDVYEAGTIDGANRWQVFRHITFPLLAPAVTINVVLLFIFGMRTYDQIAVLTGGAPGGATETVAYRVVESAFVDSHMGYASSMAIYLLLIVAIVSVLLVLVLRKREEAIQ